MEKAGEEQKVRAGQSGLRAHLVASGLVFQPWFVQNQFQLFVVEIGHPYGL